MGDADPISAAELEIFAKEARAFLDENAALLDEQLVWGHGEDVLSGYAERSPEADIQRVVDSKRWKALEFDAGFGWLGGPVELGGRGLAADYQRVYAEMRRRYDVPSQNLFGISLGMVAPTFLAHGQAIVRDRYVRRLHRGELVGCQLFSEPEAGSDVAGLTTRAVRDGDEWIVNGQKVWTSEAHNSDVGLLIARTNVDAPKHHGITAFAVDMTAPGVEVRPLTMMTGGTEFNEVFFNDVRIPDDHRLGAVDAGWSVAIYTLMNERALGAAGGDTFGVNRLLERLRMMAAFPEFGGRDPVIRQQLAGIVCRVATLRYMSLAADERRLAGLPPGPADSLFKLASTEVLRTMVDVAARMLGPKVIADTGEWGTYAWADMVLTVPGMRVAAGTDEVMRNILAERVLGLPKEPAPG